MPTTVEVMQSLPDRFQPKKAGNLSTTIQFILEGEDGGRWWMTIAEGKCHVSEGEIDKPEAIVTMQASDFVGISTGTVDPVDTFWSGKITIEGQVDVVLALPPIMNWH